MGKTNGTKQRELKEKQTPIGKVAAARTALKEAREQEHGRTIVVAKLVEQIKKADGQEKKTLEERLKKATVAAETAKKTATEKDVEYNKVKVQAANPAKAPTIKKVETFWERKERLHNTHCNKSTHSLDDCKMCARTDCGDDTPHRWDKSFICHDKRCTMMKDHPCEHRTEDHTSCSRCGNKHSFEGFDCKYKVSCKICETEDDHHTRVCLKACQIKNCPYVGTRHGFLPPLHDMAHVKASPEVKKLAMKKLKESDREQKAFEEADAAVRRLKENKEKETVAKAKFSARKNTGEHDSTTKTPIPNLALAPSLPFSGSFVDALKSKTHMHVKTDATEIVEAKKKSCDSPTIEEVIEKTECCEDEEECDEQSDKEEMEQSDEEKSKATLEQSRQLLMDTIAQNPHILVQLMQKLQQTAE